MVKHTSLGNLKCWPLWAVYEKLIFILAVVGHRVIFLDQAKGHDVSNSLEFIPERIKISGEVTNFVGMCHSYVTMDMYCYNGHIYISHRRISGI